jgi:hypothetical protein
MCQAKLLAQPPDASIAPFKASRVSDVSADLQQTEAHPYVRLRKSRHSRAMNVNR